LSFYPCETEPSENRSENGLESMTMM